MKNRVKKIVALGLALSLFNDGNLLAVNAENAVSDAVEIMNDETSVDAGEEDTSKEEELTTGAEETSDSSEKQVEGDINVTSQAKEESVRKITDGWSEDGLYYYINSEAVKGITEVKGVLYYFDDNTGELCKKAQWIEKDGKCYYSNVEGKLYRNQFISFGKDYYYMGNDGSTQKGIVKAGDGNLYYIAENGVRSKKAQWIEANGKRYYCNTEGKLYRNQFISFGKDYYYMGDDGSVQKGIVKAGDGNLYYIGENGVRSKKAQWIEENGRIYYCNAEGKLYRNQFISFGKDYYYMGDDGSVQKGIVKAGDGNLYYIGENGVRSKKAQWIEENGKKYYCNAEGKLYRNQFISFGQTYYYMGNDGSVQAGIIRTGSGDLYYAGKDGVIQKKAQWIELGEKRYYCNAEGKLYRNQVITFGTVGYCMGDDGSVQYGIAKAGGKYYHTDQETGIILKKSGWIEADGKSYYAKADGSLFQNQFISFGTTYYYCGNDASTVTGTQVVEGVVYKFDEKGVMIKEGGWGEYKGNKYYKNPATGFPYKNQWVTFGSTWYYANSKGFMVSGWQTIGGNRYYFYSDTKYMARNTTIDGIRIDANGVADPVYTYAANVLNSVGWNLHAAYNWSAALPYKNVSNNASPGSAYFATYGFQNGKGDCYVMAATFYYMAKLLGYDAHQVDGYVPRIGGGKTPHSWCEIVMNGTTYVFDPDFTNELGLNGYQITYGSSGTWRYIDWHRMN